MAVNVLSPNGLVWARNLIGAAPTVQANAYKIKKGYGTTIGFGDLVKTGAGGNQGYVVLSAFNDTNVLGVFAGVLPYYDLTYQQTQHGLNGAYVGTINPSADVDCLVISDLSSAFRIQASGGPYTASMRGQNCNWLTGSNGAPNANGISTLALDLTTIGSSNTLPLRILGVAGVPGGPQDPNNTNPVLEVTINPALIEMLQGTGI